MSARVPESPTSGLAPQGKLGLRVCFDCASYAHAMRTTLGTGSKTVK